jgi:hypothetical protein
VDSTLHRHCDALREMMTSSFPSSPLPPSLLGLISAVGNPTGFSCVTPSHQSTDGYTISCICYDTYFGSPTTCSSLTDVSSFTSRKTIAGPESLRFGEEANEEENKT